MSVRLFICLIALLFVGVPTNEIEAVSNINTTILAEVVRPIPPVEKDKKAERKARKLKRKQLRKEKRLKKQSSWLSVIFIFGIIVAASVPLAGIVGGFIVAFGFPLLYWQWIGMGLLITSNVLGLLMGFLGTGTYIDGTEEKPFYLMLWLYFGINLIFGTAFLIYGLIAISIGPLLWIFGLALLILAVLLLAWILIKTHLHKKARQKTLEK